MRFSVFIATSVDGFIARKSGNLDWLPGAESSNATDQESKSDVEPLVDDGGYQSFFSSIDSMVMGRNSMEKVLSFGIDWPYKGKKVFVLSRTLEALPEQLQGSSEVEIFKGDIKDLAQKLKDMGHKRCYIDGGLTIRSFLKARLVTDITITKIPVLLGEGIPLFGGEGEEGLGLKAGDKESENDVDLKHIKTTVFSDTNFVQTTYDVVQKKK
eukprot:Nk52_evm15s2273 gene=Nk52_evmTU15s2273